jgi:phosphoglycerol transferase MdoB-like AlkP superfamily enzyme
MKKLPYLTLILSLAFGSIIAWIDTRPHWDDTGITVGLILISSMVCGGLYPSRAWLWALIVGGILFVANVILHGNYGSVIALVVAFVGAYVGVGVRKVLSPEIETKGP